ncbi:hypothetical protein F5X68DRAFT_2343 [Plectosphaerella plurivora]|uniref:Uncharacterized protein n=1 Tax=Plectosphaerella plurivora TaxID=936078 RepID=A0A9P8VKW9_9PEZI|nr:hypothetical protein F5X68DRAFT_2343 [Plectosphaerella plurivora]
MQPSFGPPYARRHGSPGPAKRAQDHQDELPTEPCPVVCPVRLRGPVLTALLPCAGPTGSPDEQPLRRSLRLMLSCGCPSRYQQRINRSFRPFNHHSRPPYSACTVHMAPAPYSATPPAGRRLIPCACFTCISPGLSSPTTRHAVQVFRAYGLGHARNLTRFSPVDAHPPPCTTTQRRRLTRQPHDTIHLQAAKGPCHANKRLQAPRHGRSTPTCRPSVLLARGFPSSQD